MENQQKLQIDLFLMKLGVWLIMFPLGVLGVVLSLAKHLVDHIIYTIMLPTDIMKKIDDSVKELNM